MLNRYTTGPLTGSGPQVRCLNSKLEAGARSMRTGVSDAGRAECYPTPAAASAASILAVLYPTILSSPITVSGVVR